MKITAYTNNQGQQIHLRSVQMGIQSYLQQLSPSLLLHHDGTQNHPPEKRAANVKDRFDPITNEHVLINRYRTSGGSEMEVFITSRIPFVNMVGIGLGMGIRNSSSWNINSTATGSNSFNSRDPETGVPTFFSFFNRKIFYFKKFFLYL